VDSGASTTFISKRLVNDLQFRTQRFPQEIPLLNIDGTRNNAGSITHYVELTLAIPHARGHISTTVFAITDIDDQDIIIRIDWLSQHNPDINWKRETFTLQCCGHKQQPVIVKKMLLPKDFKRDYHIYKELEKMQEKNYAYKIFAGFSKSQALAIQAMDGTHKTFEELVPKQYKDHQNIFSKERSNRLPEHKSWDLEINIKEGQALPKPRKAFTMSPKELKALKEVIEQELNLGRIRSSQSETAAPVFFIKMKDEGLRYKIIGGSIQ